ASCAFSRPILRVEMEGVVLGLSRSERITGPAFRRFREKRGRGSRRSLRLWPLEIEHPIDAELIGEHPEASAPKRVLERHVDFAVLAHSREKCFDLLDTLALHGERDIVSLAERH